MNTCVRGPGRGMRVVPMTVTRVALTKIRCSKCFTWRQEHRKPRRPARSLSGCAKCRSFVHGWMHGQNGRIVIQVPMERTGANTTDASRPNW